MFGTRSIRWLWSLCIVLLAATLPATGHADIVMTGQPLTVCIAPVRPGQTVQQLFAGNIPLDCSERQARLGPGDYWALSNPVRIEGERALRSASLWQMRRTVYAHYADGAIWARSSDGTQAARNLQLGAIFLDRLPGRASPLVQVAWKIEGSANLRGVVAGARLATLRENGWANLVMAAIYAGFGGLALALLLHHFALWTAMRHRFQLAYCLMVVMLMGFAFSSSGIMVWLMPWIDNNDRMRFNYATLGLAAATALVFARTFFEERVFEGWVGKAANAIAIAVIVTSCVYAGLSPWHMTLLDRLFSLSYLVLVLFVPVFLVRAWLVRSNYLWIFALAWAAPVVFAGARVANNLGLISWSFWIDNSTLLSMTAEALISSMGIAYRIRLLGKERDEARAQELAARALADIDPLTGLLNRRAFLSRAIGSVGTQTLIILDIDHFKAVNETIGHDGGDEVLRLVARVLRTATPAGALIARIGGEEFAVVAPAHSGIDGAQVLARLRAQRMPFDLGVTASIGACSGPLTNEVDWKRLYHQADLALYQAKAEGRDRARHSATLVAA
ncbi:diguanylate cyclase domain-containing protein [Sphingomonas sp. GlSt437]|uniref:GGDEF domain-containing protein n=1 Tax=Sphingomonas sp. GlSt437 TaxID=3389970 RepID=UPI003A88F5A8